MRFRSFSAGSGLPTHREFTRFSYADCQPNADSDGDGVGDLPGITARLGHLAELGVDAAGVQASLKPQPRAVVDAPAKARKSAAQATPETALAGALKAAGKRLSDFEVQP